jgi:hypothetical protein
MMLTARPIYFVQAEAIRHSRRFKTLKMTPGISTGGAQPSVDPTPERAPRSRSLLVDPRLLAARKFYPEIFDPFTCKIGRRNIFFLERV